MARYTCKRCKADCNTLDDPHLCKDLKKRLERNAKAIDLVKNILLSSTQEGETWPGKYHYFYDEKVDDIATEIVKVLSGRNLGVD
jgi:transposase-like protein